MLRNRRFSKLAMAAMMLVAGTELIQAQTTVTPNAPAGLRLVCVSTTGALSFDSDSTTTCAGAQTAITSFTVTNGGGFTAAGTAGFSATGTGSISTVSGGITTTSGNITTSSGNITATSGTVQGATVNSTGTISVGTNLTVNGALNMTNGAISNVTTLGGDAAHGSSTLTHRRIINANIGARSAPPGHNYSRLHANIATAQGIT